MKSIILVIVGSAIIIFLALLVEKEFLHAEKIELCFSKKKIPVNIYKKEGCKETKNTPKEFCILANFEGRTWGGNFKIKCKNAKIEISSWAPSYFTLINNNQKTFVVNNK